jgi:hypothetical protein
MTEELQDWLVYSGHYVIQINKYSFYCDIININFNTPFAYSGFDSKNTRICFIQIISLTTGKKASFIARAMERTINSNDGGASGLAGVLWPLCYFLGFVSTSNYIIYKQTLVVVLVW